MNKKRTLFVLAALAGISFVVWALVDKKTATDLPVSHPDMVQRADPQAQDAEKLAERIPIVLDRPPVRKFGDPNPTPQGIAIDVERGEVFISNTNAMSGHSILAYPIEFTPTDRILEPKRRIAGPKTGIGRICGLSLSPEHMEMYFVNNDGGDRMGVFPLDATGDVSPDREIKMPHGAWDIFLESKHDELYMTIEHVNRVSVYKRTAEGEPDVLRYVQGPDTGLADPHGIYVDAERNEFYVANHGNWRHTEPGEVYSLHGEGKLGHTRGSQDYPGIVEPLGPSTGKFLPPSITVHSRTAQGNAAPLRVIQGSRTRLNFPLDVALDTASNQLVVVNSGDDSILFFDRNATGDVAPVRILKGPATNIISPSGVAVDLKRNELWVTTWDNHTATVFPRSAEGNVAPLRSIRTASMGSPGTGFGNPGDMAYDPNRNQILAPN